MILLYPPITKACEPPAGLAQLAGWLRNKHLDCEVIDLNLAGQLYLMKQKPVLEDTWSRRAWKNRDRNLAAIRDSSLHSNFSRYEKCVNELNRLLSSQGTETISLSLTNYQDSALSPGKSTDLLVQAAHPETNVFYPFFEEQMENVFAQKDPAIIGISVNFLNQALCAFALIGTLRKLKKDVTIIVGGGLITSWMRSRNWESPFDGVIDHCVAGSGEEFLASFFHTEATSETSLYFTGNESPYLSPGRILPYSTSTGCLWNKCTFCPEPAEKSIFSKSSPVKIGNDLTHLVEKYTPDLVHFLDNSLPLTTLRQLIESPPNCPWYGFVRASSRFLDPDFCISLKKSGCVMLKLGVESGDQNVLEKMNKGTRIETVSQVLVNLHRAGIATYVYLLFGTPQETYASARKTLKFTLKHHREITFLNLAIFNMPLFADNTDHLQKHGFSAGDLSLYTNFIHPQGWDRKKVRRFLDKEFRKVPEIAAIIRRDPPFFTSNHAPFFCKG